MHLISNIATNFWLAFFLYWVPLALCFFGYVIRTWRNYQKDVIARESEKYYFPTDTVGSIIGRALISIIPLANLLALSFDIAPWLLSNFFNRIKKIFDQPLVPEIDRTE